MINIKFDGETIYVDNDKYKKTTVKLYGVKVNTNFQGKRVSNEDVPHKCLSLIMLHSVIRVSKKHYPQTLMEE